MNNEKVNLDLKTLKFLYDRYKDFGIPIIVIAVCVYVFMQFLFPQFQNIIVLSQEAKEASSKISILRNNIKILSSLNDSTLDSYLQLLNTAVPDGKDFIGIINAISYASSLSGVNVGDFKLSIGDLSEEAANTNTFSSIAVGLSVNGGIEEVNRFIEALNRTLPLSEATNISLGTRGSSVDVNFYYKSLPPIKQDDFSVIKPFSNDNLTLINNLSKFNYNFTGNIGFTETDSNNAEGSTETEGDEL